MYASKPPSRIGLFIIFGLVALVACIGIAMRLHAASKLRQEAKDNGVVAVAVIKAAGGPQTEEIVLPGDVQAWHEATIYARTNGYVKQWYKGMGTRVHKGELLAEIETPEVDAELRQAEADLKTAEANNQLAQITAKRWKDLLKTDSVSKQETDEKIGDAAAKSAALASAKANRDHLYQLESFKRVVAPFDGIITSRTLDIGMLVNDGSFGQFQALFHIAQAEHLRIYVKVPENYAAAITPDVIAELHFTEHPGKIYMAWLLKTADAIEPVSRTFLVEFETDSPNGELLSGGYAEVHIKLPTASSNVRLPVNTLIFRADGLQVATVDANNRAVLKSVTMGRDFGNEVEISAGLTPNEPVIINPPDSLATGQQVRIIAPENKENKENKKP